MTKLMAVSLTEAAVRAQTKPVTRRVGWWTDRRGRRLLLPGQHLVLCRKVMGRKPDEPIVRICEVEVIDVRRERLNLITPAEVAREGVPVEHFTDLDDTGQPSPEAWARWFAKAMRIDITDHVTRIEWRYLTAPGETP